MSLPEISRRQLLCGLLPGLAAWLCPRPPRAAAAPIAEATNIAQPIPLFAGTTYSYDAGGNCTIGS